MDTPQTVNVWELSDLRTPWSIFVVATLDVARHISQGRSTVVELAEVTGCDQDVLHAILGHLVGRGVFEETSPGTFALNEPARQLLDPITRVSLSLEDIGGRFAKAWGTLLQLARSGKPAYDRIFGLSFWDDLAAPPSWQPASMPSSALQAMASPTPISRSRLGGSLSTP